MSSFTAAERRLNDRAQYLLKDLETEDDWPTRDIAEVLTEAEAVIRELLIALYGRALMQ